MKYKKENDKLILEDTVINRNEYSLETIERQIDYWKNLKKEYNKL